jgi:NADH dehydrogenase [ubiquinone] 1 alpha subcomplex assembly factor 1
LETIFTRQAMTGDDGIEANRFGLRHVALVLFIVFLGCASGGYAMAEAGQGEIRLEDLQWRNRVVLVFVPPGADAAGLAKRFEDERLELEERDIRYFVIGSEIRSNGPSLLSRREAEELRTRYAQPGQGMSVALIGKDGGLKYRADHLDFGAIYREIDAMPMRQREMQRPRKTVFDFSEPGALAGWQAADDVVMGGVSESGMIATERGTVLFQGVVSLEHGGGFASVRKRGLDADLGGYVGFLVRVRGDGGKYQLRVRTDDRFDGISYRYLFVTEPDQWTLVRAPFAEFEPVFRGRRVENAAPLDPARIRQIGFMIAHKQAGTFRLEIRSIEAYGVTSTDGPNRMEGKGLG